MAQSKHWAFTLNNYEDVDELTSLPDGVVYLVYGREVGESGTPHLQGHCSWDRRIRLTQASRLFSGRAHWSVARVVPNSIKYCKKDGDYVELGQAPPSKGQRTDLDAFKEAVRGGPLTIDEVREEHSGVYARYRPFCLEYIHQHAPKRDLPVHPPKAWQILLNQRLDAAPNDREIVFVVDETGGAGKSYYSAAYQMANPSNTLLCLPGKKADMVYALNTCGFAPRVVFVDCPRSKQGEFIQYDFLEELKNGVVFNTKYESRMIYFPVPHVVVFMNEQPDKNKLSEDRYVIITL